MAGDCGASGVTTPTSPTLSLWNSLPRAWHEDDGTRRVDPVRAGDDTVAGLTFALDGPRGRGRLSGAPSTFSGVALALRDRVLLRSHADPRAPGIYAVTELGTGLTGVWDRAEDCVGDALAPGLTTCVTEGALAGTLWRLAGVDALAVDADALRFEEVDPTTLSVMESLVRALDAELAAAHGEITGLAAAHDPYTCEARFLPELAGGLGWKLDARLPLAVQRKLVALLTLLYARKGTRPGLAAFVRLLTGSEVRVRAVRASGWRLGRARLGLRTLRFTAAGGETTFDITPIVPDPATPEGQYRAETFGELRVRRNGELLSRAEVRQPTAASVQFVRGVRRVVRVGEQTIALGFDLTALEEVEAFVNGEPVPLGEIRWSSTAPDQVIFPGDYRVFVTGDEVVVRSSVQTAPLGPGDEIVVQVPPAERTRLASTLPRPWPGSPTSDDLAAYDRARTLLVEVARRLVSSSEIDEPAAVGHAVGVMASSLAKPVLTAPHLEPRPRWVLGRSRLGRDTRL